MNQRQGERMIQLLQLIVQHLDSIQDTLKGIEDELSRKG